MDDDIRVFRKSLLEQVHAAGSVAQTYMHEAFVQEVRDQLIAAEEIPDLTPCDFKKKGARKRERAIDGFCLDEADLDHSVSLVVVDFKDRPDEDVPPLTQPELDAAVKGALNFVEDAVNGVLHPMIEPSHTGYDLALWLFEHRSKVSSVRLFVVADTVLGTRTRVREQQRVGDIRVEVQVWDLARLMRASGNGGREPIEIDLKELAGGGLPALPASVGDTTYSTYLCVVRGDVLASLYERYGARLLEGNVRSFLSVKGGVNRGIQNTIKSEPARFFAYNNGITATAADATFADTPRGKVLTTVKDLQIVNGGQTTASMFYAARSPAAENLKKVHVQMKLSVVLPADADALIPNIARFANTQNKVSEADLFSNHQFHRRIDETSERIWAPAAPGATHQTRWYYERARGQYVNAQARLGAAKKKEFLQLHPKKQLLTKTDLAKHENTWAGLPHIVSRGAQKNFVSFATAVTENWERDERNYNDRWFEHTVAKAIVFRGAEALVDQQPWYEGGYRANIVTYGIARLVHEVQKAKSEIDLDRIWRSQALSVPLKNVLVEALALADEVIRAPPAGMSNLSEWAKKEDCWSRMKERKLQLPPEFVAELRTKAEVREDALDARKEQQLTNEVQALMAVVNLGSDYWKKVLAWHRETGGLSPKEVALVTKMAVKRGFVPPDWQAPMLLSVHNRLTKEGFVVR